MKVSISVHSVPTRPKGSGTLIQIGPKCQKLLFIFQYFGSWDDAGWGPVGGDAPGRTVPVTSRQ